MTRYTTDLIRTLARTHHRSQAHYARALREILATITDELAAGHRLQLTDFGTFYTHHQSAANIRDIRTRKIITIGAHRRVAFRPGQRLRQAAQQKPLRPTTGKPRLKRLLGLGRHV